MTDDALDGLLRDWAVRHALPTARADAIRDTVLAAPQMTVNSLPAGWWNGFAAHLKTTLRQSTSSIGPGVRSQRRSGGRGKGG